MVVYFAVGIPGNESSPEVYLEYHIGKNLWKYCSPVMIVLGTIGNIFSIVVLLQKSMRRQTTVMYLVALSFNDMAVLYIGLLRYWILVTFEIDVRHFSEFLCKVHIWLVYVTVDTSAWILVVVSFERLALVWYPHITKSVCTRTTAISILVAVVGTLMLINSHIMYGIGDVMKVENNQTTLLQCFFEHEDYQRFYVSIWPWIDLAIFNAIPFSIILFCNICILSNLYKRKQKIKHSSCSAGDKKEQGPISNNNPHCIEYHFSHFKYPGLHLSCFLRNIFCRHFKLHNCPPRFGMGYHKSNHVYEQHDKLPALLCWRRKLQTRVSTSPHTSERSTRVRSNCNAIQPRRKLAS